MTNREQHEKLRQAIMRYRELMDIAQAMMARAERDYHHLFADVPEQARATLAEKALQGEAAKLAMNNLKPLQDALLRLRFGFYDLSKEFEQTYNNTVPAPEDESDL